MKTIDVNSTESARKRLVNYLTQTLYGPVDENDISTIEVAPESLYATGVLFPQRSMKLHLEEDASSEDVRADNATFEESLVDVEPRKVPKSSVDEDGRTDSSVEAINLANEYNPSAMGLSFKVQHDAKIQISGRGATYRREQLDESGHYVFKRVPFSFIQEIFVERLDPKRSYEVAPSLDLSVTKRVRDNTVIVSAVLINRHILLSDQRADYKTCFFQPFLCVESCDGQPIFQPIENVSVSDSDVEAKRLNLLHRKNRTYALGHGVAANWELNSADTAKGSCFRITSDFLPRYTVPKVAPRERYTNGSRIDLSMSKLAGHVDDRGIFEILDSLVADYRAWISQLENEEIEREFQEEAEKNRNNCIDCASRMAEGVQLLRSDHVALQAFKLMNHAMDIQQQRSRLRPREKGGAEVASLEVNSGNSWRAFQLGFILCSLASVCDPEHTDRSKVELIWFPTGGGKTEAYLGLAAFQILFTRLGNKKSGTEVLMRYTLRLLARQQFDRASALIFALEYLRRNKFSDQLGSEPISIGMWVGNSLTPNIRSDAQKSCRDLKRAGRQKNNTKNVFQILHCPWCKTSLTANNFEGYHATHQTVVFRCPEKGCDFHGSELPIKVIDEDIYDAPPTMLVGTVDKFAQITWHADTKRIFGQGSQTRPNLIIQDELHLISGPLGTIVALYEAVIDRLCSFQGKKPKIVASTATIRRAEKQCKDLFARASVEFPPQGHDINENYFAQIDTKAPGREYLGFMGSAVQSHQTALVRVATPLLQFAKQFDTNQPNVADHIDPYTTLVWYFNTLRELGHAHTLCTADIREYFMQFRRNHKDENGSRHLNHIEELTSRINADDIPVILEQLQIDLQQKQHGKYPIDVLLATNMISVGVDIDRLGLMLVNGQPKGTSEYIQATSRVGRKHPGLVVVAYSQTKNRDRSHYENFKSYHQNFYKHVEPTSVTPFALPARERVLPGLVVAIARQLCGFDEPMDITNERKKALLQSEVNILLQRARKIDPHEADDTEKEIDRIIQVWESYLPKVWGQMGKEVKDNALLKPYGDHEATQFTKGAFEALTSMRNVDGSSEAKILINW